MKILLIGEFSGVHNNLKKGLIELGHEVTLAADGDGYRGFKYDIPLNPVKGKFLSKILNPLYMLFNIKKFTGYDVIQFLYPFSINYISFLIGIPFLLLKYNKKSVYYVCGTDPAFLKSREKFQYFPFNNENISEAPSYNKVSLTYYDWFINNISIIIPSMYTYAVGYLSNPKLRGPIPLPGSGNYNINVNTRKNSKLNILFGITRKGFKGADFIIPALKKIKEEFPDKVEIKIVERLPFNEYIELLKESDVLIDQCNSYDYGMNTIFALENGVIVFSGAESDAKEYLKIKDSPVINIRPDSNHIYQQIKKLITIGNCEYLKIQSVEYVKDIHDVHQVAFQFSDLYTKE